MTLLYQALRMYTAGPVHWLKCDPEPFQRVARQVKTLEIRLNDRNYQAGDLLVLQEHDRIDEPQGVYSGEWVLVRVLDVYEGHPGLTPGYAALSTQWLAQGCSDSPHWPIPQEGS